MYFWYATVPGASKLPFIGRTEVLVAVDVNPAPDWPGLRSVEVDYPRDWTVSDYKRTNRAVHRLVDAQQWLENLAFPIA